MSLSPEVYYFLFTFIGFVKIDKNLIALKIFIIQAFMIFFFGFTLSHNGIYMLLVLGPGKYVSFVYSPWENGLQAAEKNRFLTHQNFALKPDTIFLYSTGAAIGFFSGRNRLSGVNNLNKIHYPSDRMTDYRETCKNGEPSL